MSISRSLNLNVVLKGVSNFKNQLRSLQTEATKLQSILSNQNIGTGSFTGNGGRGYAAQFTAPLEAAVAGVKAARINLSREFKDLGNFASSIKNIKNLKQLPNITPNFTNQTFTNSFTSYTSFDTLKKQATEYRNLRIKHADDVAKAEKAKLTEVSKDARSLIQTGFGLHIVQMYFLPILYAFEQISAKMISTYSEFDKMFTDYMVKSEEYGEWLSQSDFYKGSVGQTYGITDAASAAERFAASGVDVAKSQQALTSVMQVATVAQMDYRRE